MLEFKSYKFYKNIFKLKIGQNKPLRSYSVLWFLIASKVLDFYDFIILRMLHSYLMEYILFTSHLSTYLDSTTITVYKSHLNLSNTRHIHNYYEGNCFIHLSQCMLSIKTYYNKLIFQL